MSTKSSAKTLVLLRHAKSSWGLDVDDHERPLSTRGKRDGLAVGEYLVKHRRESDIVYCSTAIRARQTWDRAVKVGAHAGEVTYTDRIYEAFVPELIKVLRKTPEQASTVLMIGHSPGIPDLVEKLAVRKGNKDLWSKMDTKFPTSAFAIVEYDGKWEDLSGNSAQLINFVVARG